MTYKTILDYNTNHEILDFLDSDSLIQVSTLNKEYHTKYRDIIYYRHAYEKKLLYSLSYFLEDEFTVPFLTNSIQTLLDYVSARSDLLIAGGFPTQLYMGKTPNEKSDIDIYVLANESIKNGELLPASLIEQVKSFIEFLENSYTVIGMVRVGPSVYTIYVKEIEHPIQMIVTTNGTPAEILSSFDNSHNRCGMYRGHTYIGMDTKISHQRMVTYFYSTPKACRYKKAVDLGFNIFGLSDGELARIMEEPNVEQVRMLQKLQIGTIVMDLLGIKAHKNWKISYADQELVTSCYDVERVELDKELSEEMKKVLSRATTKKYVGNRKILRLTQDVKDTDSYYIKIRKPFMTEYVFSVKGLYVNNNGVKKIIVSDKEDMEKMKVVKSTTLEIFKAYHGGIPEEIKKSRCLSSWEDFISYRMSIGVPITGQIELIELMKEGYEYYDGIIINNNDVQIKNIEPNLLTISLRDTQKTFHMSMTPVIKYAADSKVCTWGTCEYRIKSIE
jgi:hypothetical protein